MATATLPLLTPNDFSSDREVRWCPGCGDFSILSQLKKVLAVLNVPREKMVFVSGLGCAGRLPYYLSTYGFHGSYGRAPALATGLKLANPDLQVWVVTGDGDALSAGATHLIHALRRNVDLKILLFNNEVFGLSKGQASPTARPGTRTKTSPEGSFETPLRPISLALAAEATFVARTIDVDVNHMSEVLEKAAAHRGAAFVEIYQNCKIFNDGVFEYATDASIKTDTVIYLEHGRPLLFGRDRNQGLRLNGFEPEAVTLGHGITMDDILIHDERASEPTLAFLLSRLIGPHFPECLGVFRSVQRPTHQQLLDESFLQGDPPRLFEKLLAGDESWLVA
ncbi:MAG: 2-oxoacid:ferredoxin oxidoreductase subunit beta [Planctomycetes bacterium]|nr:2-oxoacid:ferredoxin oxidoreductase subunit beta [Planctomycetota bacterium]